MLGECFPSKVIESGAEGSFWYTGIASYVRQRKRGMLLRRKQESAECKEDFSTLLEMTVWGNGFISRSVQRICLESAIPHNVIPSEVEGSFWHTGIALYVRQRKRGNLLRKEQESAECKEDFSLRSK